MMTATRPATTQQHTDIRKLLSDLEDLGVVGIELAASARKNMNDTRFVHRTWSFQVASCWITALVTMRNEQRDLVGEAKSTVVDREPLPEIPDGRYAVEVDGVMKFYRIRTGNGGYVQGWVQASDEEYRLEFPVLKAIMNKIADVTPLEAFKAYGREIGACGKCGRTLTNPESIANGIGPVCAGKLG